MQGRCLDENFKIGSSPSPAATSTLIDPSVAQSKTFIDYSFRNVDGQLQAQDNDYDCGVFIMKYIRAALGNVNSREKVSFKY